MGRLVGANALERLRKIPRGVSLCSIKLFLLFLPGVNMAVRRWSSALRAAFACGVGALLRLPADAGVAFPLRIDRRRSRVALRSSGVWTRAARRFVDGGSALFARRFGVWLFGVAADARAAELMMDACVRGLMIRLVCCAAVVWTIPLLWKGEGMRCSTNGVVPAAVALRMARTKALVVGLLHYHKPTWRRRAKCVVTRRG